MRFELRGGDTWRPMLWVSASANTASMGFDITQQVWDYIKNNDFPLNFGYSRKFIQAQLDSIQGLLDAPLPVPSASGAAGRIPVASRSGGALVPVVLLLASATAGAVAVGVHHITRRRPGTEGPQLVVPVDESPGLRDDEREAHPSLPEL